MAVFVIAEAGSSHDNDLAKAHRLIEAAKECGADAVKFQWTGDAREMALRRAGYQKGEAYEAMALMYEAYLSKAVGWLENLKAHADRVEIEFMCTVYIERDIQIVNPLVNRFKVSAFESSRSGFISAHERYGKPIIASVNPGLEVWWAKNIQWLHCISEYPCPRDHVQLSRIRELKGFSDHTGDPTTGQLAVAAGAQVIEAHIRLDSTLPTNPDYKHSLRCDVVPYPEFKAYVANIRTVERML